MPISDDEYPLELQISNAQEQLRIYDALSRAFNEPARLMEIFANAADPQSAVETLASEFGFDRTQCAVVLDAQFRRVTIGERQRIAVRRDELIEELSALRDAASRAGE